MSNSNLAACLTAHLAGSGVALDLLAQLETSYDYKINGQWRCQVSGGDRMNKARVNEIGAQNDGLACCQTRGT